MSNIKSCIVCGDSGYSFVENPILFCYTCKGNLNEEQMMRIQRALQNSDLTEFREELLRAKDWAEDVINRKNTAIARLTEQVGKLNNEIKQLKNEKANQYSTIQNYQNKIDDFRSTKNDNITGELIKELNYANKLRRQIEWERKDNIDTTLHTKALEDTLHKIDTIQKKIAIGMSKVGEDDIVISKSTYEQLKRSYDGNLLMLKRAQELGIEAEIELLKIKKAISLMRENVDDWLKDNTKYDATPTISMHDYFVAVDMMIKQLEEIYK